MAIVLVVLFGVAALVVDLGMARATRARAQVAADAAALAAADVLSTEAAPDRGLARRTAQDFAAANLSEAPDWGDCRDDNPLAVQSFATQCVSFDDRDNPSLVRVLVVPESQPALFGAIFGADRYTVSGAAEARVARARTAPCDGPCVSDGAPDLSDPEIFDDVFAEVAATLVPDPPPMPPPTPSPPLPLPPTPVDHLGCPAPGVYDDVRLRSEPCVLDAGTYVILDELDVPAGAVLTGDDVTIYLGCWDATTGLRRCHPFEDGGRVDGHLGSSVTLNGDACGGRGPGSAVGSQQRFPFGSDRRMADRGTLDRSGAAGNPAG